MRTPAFTRKPNLVVAIGTKGAPDPAKDTPTDEAEADEGPATSPTDKMHDEQDVAVCPNCGCVFNDETGEVLNEDHPQHPANGKGPTMMPNESHEGSTDESGSKNAY